MKVKILSLLLAFSLVFAMIPFTVTAESETGSPLSYMLYSGEYYVESCNTNATKVIIPSQYKGIPVTKIAFGAFKYCEQLESVSIPDSITSIGDDAFSHCINLSKITIPKSVTYIGRYAFYDCPSLETIVVDEENTIYHSDKNCIIETAANKLLIGGKNSIIPDDGSVTTIGECSFASISTLENFSIPNTITSIESYAFRDSALTEITIPGSVESIGFSIFAGCEKLKSITVASNNPIFHSDKNCIIETATKKIVVGCGNSSIPDDGSVTIIGNSAFWGCSNLTHITIPSTIETIEYAAFAQCRSLNSIILPDSVKTLENHVFESCTFNYLYIPDSVTNIYPGTFYISPVTTVLLEAKQPPETWNESNHIAGTTIVWGVTLDDLAHYMSKGDIDNDGKITADDYIILKRIYFGQAKTESLADSENALVRCDINESGDIDADDYILLKRVYFGMYSL